MSAADNLRYLGDLQRSADRYGVHIHAYVLMTNHVHLLVTPSRDDGVSRMMQYLGRSFVLAFNRIHGRSGTLWEGRFRSTMIHSEQHLFACYRYIELNPVRAGLVRSPADYPWSSFRANALGAKNAIIQPRTEWLELGSSPKTRCRNYRALFDTPLSDELTNEIRSKTR